MIPILVLAALQAQALTLREAERRAEVHQPALTMGEYAAAAAAGRATESRAPLLPQVTATAAYRYATGNRTIRIGTPSFATSSLTSGARAPATTLYDYLNTSLTATQLLYDFGQSSEAWRAARLLADSATLDARGIRLMVLLDVRLAFFAARARRELLEVSREDLANQLAHLAQVQGLVDVKLKPPIDLLQARASVGAAELRQLAADNEYALARADLDRAMGSSGGGEYEIASDDLPPVEGEDADAEALLAQAAQSRPDVASTDRQIDAQQRALAAARGGYGPTLHLALNATDSGPMFDPGPFEWRNLRWNYSAALVLAWPIFEGGRSVSRVRQVEAGLGEARARRTLLYLGLRVEVERARRGVATAKAAMRIAQTTLESARERLGLAAGRYKAGVGTALEVSDAQLVYVTIAGQRVQSQYALAAARAQLLHALGRER